MQGNEWRGAAMFAASMVTVGFAARAGYLLFGGSAELPPEDPALLKIWERKRRWLLLSELSAIPCFVALTILFPAEWLAWVLHVPAASGELRGLFGLAMGSLGFPFVSGIAKAAIERKLGSTGHAG